MTSPIALSQQSGVLAGCAVTANSPAAFNVLVAAGVVAIGGQVYSTTGGTVTIASADSVADRTDAIVVDTTGTAQVIAGAINDGITPIPPTIDPTVYALLAYVTVLNSSSPSYTATIVTAAVDNQPNGVALLSEPGQTFALTLLNTAWTSGDPGTGNCQFDNVNWGSVAKLQVNYTSASAPQSFMTWLQTGASSSAPWGLPYFLRLWSRKDPSKWLVAEVTAFTDHSTYGTLTCTIVGTSAGAITNSPPLSTDALDTILEFAGIVSVTSPTATNGSAFLGGDVNPIATASWSDGPNTGALASGTYYVIAKVTLLGTATAGAKVTTRLWDGTTAYDESENTVGSASTVSEITVFGIVPGGATYKVSVRATAANAILKAAAVDNSGGNLATQIAWFKLA